MDPGPAYKRRRPAIACTECRRRKIRCDRQSPCGPCSKSMPSLRCVYNNQPTTRIPEIYLDPGMHMHQHDSLVSLGLSHTNSRGQEQPMLATHPFDETGQDLDLFNLDVGPVNDHTSVGFVDMDFFGLNEVSHSKSTSMDSASSMPTGPSRSPSWATSSLPSTMASSLTSSLQQNQHLPPAIDSRRSSTVRFGDKYHPAIDDHCDEWYQPFSRCEKLGFLVDSLSSENLHLQPEQEAVRPLLETYKRLCQAVQDDQENEPFGSNWASTQNAARDMLPCRRTCDALLDAYIKTFESVLRIVHVPSFLRDYEHFWENSTSSAVSNDETFECKLLLAAALGSTTIVPSESQRFQAISLREQANSWIAYAKDWLARRTIKGMRADLSMAQISCLLALTRHTHPQDAAPMGVAWLSEGHGLTHIAVQMGLHREPRSRSSCMSVKEAEIRRRLWATMLELSIQISVDQGLPAPLAPESYDCEAPSSIADDDLYLGIESQDATSSTVLMLLVQTQRLRLRILQLVNAPGSSKTYQECCTLATELNAAYCSSLEKLTSMGKTPPTDFQVKLMDVFTRPFVLALHEPFAEQACAKPEYYYSQRMRMEVSAQLLKSPMNQGSYAALLTHGHGHFLLAQRKATMSLCLDLIREQEENSFPSLDSASRRQLRDVLLGSVDIFQRRVRATGGADSTVEFLLFSCAVACIEAMQQNSGRGKINEAILEAAKTGLSFCCGTMERQRRRESRPGSRPSEKIGEPDLMQMLMG